VSIALSNLLTLGGPGFAWQMVTPIPRLPFDFDKFARAGKMRRRSQYDFYLLGKMWITNANPGNL
jgi:hypothetical protein